MIPPAWDASPGALALRDAMAGVARVLSRDWSPGERTRAELTAEVRSASRGRRWRTGSSGRSAGARSAAPSWSG